MEIQYDVVEYHNQCRLGKTETVLIEGYDKVVKLYFGRTYRDSIDVDAKVFVKSVVPLDIGAFYDVKLTEVIDYDMLGVYDNTESEMK